MENKELIIKQLHKKVAPFARKIAPVYKALDWTWYGCDRNDKIIPDAVDIAIALTKMIEKLRETGYLYVATGGLAVKIEEDSEDRSCLTGRIDFQMYEEVYGDE